MLRTPQRSGSFPGLGTAALAPERGTSTGILSKSLTLGDDSGKMCQDKIGEDFKENTADFVLVDIC